MRRKLSMEDLPVWLWSTLVTEDSFVQIPPNFTWPEEEEDESAEEGKAAAAAPSSEPKKEIPLFRYAKVKTQYCVDKELSFCESLAVVYSRILEDRGEKIFLKGNAFAAKIAKAVFEQNEGLFAEACGKYKDEEYFRKCAEAMKEWNFSVEEGEGFSDDSWLSLYKAVLLLTGEYLATKCELPKISAFECGENSENADGMEIIVTPQSASEEDIKGANIAPLELEREGLYDSSDSIMAGELFYEFLSDNFPFKDNQDKLSAFIEKIYGKDVCKSFSVKDTAAKSLPRPKFNIDAMDSNRLGSYENKTISINQRLVLDAFSSESHEARFILLLTMLLEYGRFLNDVLHEKAKKPAGSSNGDDGKAFMREFMECSDGKLLKEESFMFADFTAPDAKGKEQKFTVEASGLGYEQRLDVFCILGIKKEI